MPAAVRLSDLLGLLAKAGGPLNAATAPSMASAAVSAEPGCATT